MAKSAAAELWTFSLAVYGAPGAQAACLGLQERHGIDVNLLLFGLWSGARGRALTQAELRRAASAVAAWRRQVLLPLRAVRDALKGETDAEAKALRKRVLAQELEAERLEQRRLLAALTPLASAPDPRAAAVNLQRYLRVLRVEAQADDVADLATLMIAAFPDLPPLLAVWFLLP